MGNFIPMKHTLVFNKESKTHELVRDGNVLTCPFRNRFAVPSVNRLNQQVLTVQIWSCDTSCPLLMVHENHVTINCGAKEISIPVEKSEDNNAGNTAKRLVVT